ncbi:MAG: GH116 family glycosyl hydrolase, partial [Acidobacteria bacterium]|nr:GH116 family glycosyl hydrolase [Acidobacteriota bacterium]
MMQRRNFIQFAGAASLTAAERSPLLSYWPALQGMISTGDPLVDQAAAIAIRALKTNVSEKWGKLCPVAGPPWEKHYPAWIHPFDNFWMLKVTPYLYPRDQAEWPVVLFEKYQRSTGMIGWGVHDIESPEKFHAALEKSGKAKEESANSRYIRDHLYILQVCDVWWHYGDSEWARRMLPSCRKALDYLYSMKDLDRDGLIESASILEDIDIGSTAESTGPNAAERAVDQVMLFGALVAYARMAESIGEQAESRKARDRAAALKAKVNELFWHEKGYYRFALDAKSHKPVPVDVTSTYANGYALLFGMV